MQLLAVGFAGMPGTMCTNLTPLVDATRLLLTFNCCLGTWNGFLFGGHLMLHKTNSGVCFSCATQCHLRINSLRTQCTIGVINGHFHGAFGKRFVKVKISLFHPTWPGLDVPVLQMSHLFKSNAAN